ncbi:winged helix-turn-helix transcriptional regulator [Actinoplanes sp. TBRC 11911]|uniref:MarR family winged helix-turn-helix transcriptional regulator n=1 Tax=Actinoplanes sp. TBRC 11911 TaxID=2729386 RepID=UPI00145CF79A|nr:MarR family winged helix-turn-helix transcriptional regulator [Actinoplanes sp. TBRC 11911]NMO52423.1 winged helix-turn-helix transcriptional regulator [Actinoplanes sp. TBRC 11911]
MTAPRWLTDEQQHTWAGFLAVHTALTKRVEQQLRIDAGLSHSQYEVLVRLSAAPDGKLRMTELAGVARTSKSGLTYQVDQLESAGLVRRSAAPGDDRGWFAALTPAGRRLLDETGPAHAELVRTLFVDVLTEAQFAGLTEAIKAIRTGLNV